MELELFSSYLYFAMGAHLEMMGLPGLAHWMFVQAQEEFEHFNVFRRFLMYDHLRPRLNEIQAPPDTWNSYWQPFELALAHEHKVTAEIKKLHTQAKAAKEHRALALLQLFLDEQEEELAHVGAVLKMVKGAKSERELANIDHDLGTRPPPTPFPVDWDELRDIE